MCTRQQIEETRTNETIEVQQDIVEINTQQTFTQEPGSGDLFELMHEDDWEAYYDDYMTNYEDEPILTPEQQDIEDFLGDQMYINDYEDFAYRQREMELELFEQLHIVQ